MNKDTEFTPPYICTIIDEKVDMDLLTDIPVTRSELDVVLKLFGGMNQFARKLYFRELEQKHSAQIIASAQEVYHFSISAKDVCTCES